MSENGRYPHIRQLVRGIYDVQKLRIQAGNRLAAHYRVKLGADSEDNKIKARELFKQLKREYRRITDGLISSRDVPKNFVSEGLISTDVEFCLVKTYLSLLEEEELFIKVLEANLEDIPLYNTFLKKVKGVGPLISGVIVSEIDFRKATYVSNIWSYCGLGVVNGIGQSRRAGCMKKMTIIGKDGKPKEITTLGYNTFLKSKLVGVLGSNFLKLKSPYADFYYDYKNRLEQHPDHKDKTKNHKHRMSIRYMIKMFIKDLYVHGRQCEGLPVYNGYEEAKLGIKHKKEEMKALSS